ncbi:MAG: fibronectin type III domain-containing protein [Armatimonadota bacterium]
MNRVTQAEREAAAARAAAKGMPSIRDALKAGVPIPSSPSALMDMPMPDPGVVPHYFGPEPNWAFSPPLRKFVDGLPGLGPDNANERGQYIPVGVPDTVTYPGSDYYEIELRQYKEKMHLDLPETTLRGYVQVKDGVDVAPIHYLGPMIIAQKDRPVRIKFTNKLPTGKDGDLFIPVDTTVMGAGMGPDNDTEMYTQNRATIHLHGGKTPWISDGTPHQWITPAGENTSYPKGVSVRNVPDMPDPGPGSMTFFYTNQQSARLMFYHDHAYGITRLNVYAGEAAGYMIVDDVEKKLIADGIIPADQIPLIIQDKTFVDADTIGITDPTWRWGSMPGMPMTGDLWLPHVYVPAQNPYDLSGMNAFGRWHYGPWFWPPTTDVTHGPADNPYYDPENAPWEPPQIPGVPHPSMGMEAFFDTPVVNGTAFPSLTVEPKSYRFRILNAANDRFWNLQLYEADSSVVSSDGRRNTEVKMVDASPNTGLPENWPADGREGGVPDPNTAGPSFIQIGTEGGFLPMPAVVENQPIAWNSDPTTFNFGNVSDHALLLGPAERADVIIDFSKYAGKTLILYNDAPAAFPALDPRCDYYTGAPDLTDTGGHWGPLAGFGPNTRTIMQIKVEGTPADEFNLTALENEFKSTATSQGVFQKGQDPIIVGQSAYDSTYNTAFPTRWPNWGYSRIHDNSMSFKTVDGSIMTVPFKAKAIQDEMGEAFDKEYGRMSGFLGLELPFTNAGNQTFVLQAYMDPATEVIKNGEIQIWKITHNGVDTHPVHFHFFDVQLINRVGWDGAIRLPDPNELGWKDTVRVSPLEDTIVALRPIAPSLPFIIPNSIRALDPTMPLGSTMGFTNLDPLTGQPITTINTLANYGWEYMWHCHILSHEEMDMMRPIVFIATPLDPINLRVTNTTSNSVRLAWNDEANNEQGYIIERSTVGQNGPWIRINTVAANTTTYNNSTNMIPNTNYWYRVQAYNENGYSNYSNVVSATISVIPTAPTDLRITDLLASSVKLAWNDNSGNEQGFVIQRSVAGENGPWITINTVGPNVTTYSNTNVSPNTNYWYRVRAYNINDYSAYTNVVSCTTLQAAAGPTNLRTTSVTTNAVRLAWDDNSSNEQGFTIQRSVAGENGPWITINTVGPNVTTYYNSTNVSSNTNYWYRVRAFTINGNTAFSNVLAVTTQ